MTDHAALIAEARAEAADCRDNYQDEAGDLYDALADALTAADARKERVRRVLAAIADQYVWREGLETPDGDDDGHYCRLCGGTDVAYGDGQLRHDATCVVTLARGLLEETT